MGDGLRGAMAIYENDSWVTAQQSVVAMFGGASEEFLEGWPKAGALRGTHVHRRGHVEIPRVRAGDYWPTPAASVPNETEDPASWLARWLEIYETRDINTGVPLGIAAAAPVVLQLASRRGVEETRRVLAEHARDPDPELLRSESLNPGFAEALMGFPAGWTVVDD